MTRIIRVELCDECPHAVGSRSCRATTWCDEGGIIRTRKFTDHPLIPDWCPLEQSGPDWRPPATIDLNGPPSYARDATAGDENTKLRAVREVRETAKPLLEVQGELAANPVVNITLFETQLNEIRALVLGDLCPACQAAVAQRLKARKQQKVIDA